MSIFFSFFFYFLVILDPVGCALSTFLDFSISYSCCCYYEFESSCFYIGHNAKGKSLF